MQLELPVVIKLARLIDRKRDDDWVRKVNNDQIKWKHLGVTFAIHNVYKKQKLNCQVLENN